MAEKLQAEAEPQAVDCGEVMDIAGMVQFHPLLMEALASKQTVVFEASQLERVDTAALQVLSAFVQDANSQQQGVHWKNPSEALLRAAELLGLSALLNLDSSPSG